MSKSHRAKSAPSRRRSRKHLKSRRKSAPVLSPTELKKRLEERKRIALQLMSTGGKSRRKSRRPRRPRKLRRKSDGGCLLDYFPS